MVDSIKHNIRQVMAPSAQDAKVGTTSKNNSEAGISTSLSNSVDESKVGIKESVSALTDTPPIDTEVVNKIKEAIQAGNYPVNLDLISERLMESYLEMRE